MRKSARIRRGRESRCCLLRTTYCWKARPAARQVASLRFQSTAMPVSLQKESRKASDLAGAASSSAKTGAATTRLPRIKAVSSAERARVFKVSSSFQRAMRTLLSTAVVIARAACEPKPQPPFSHGQRPGFRRRDIFKTGCLLAQGGRGCPLGLSRRATCHQGEPPARVEFRGEQ